MPRMCRPPSRFVIAPLILVGTLAGCGSNAEPLTHPATEHARAAEPVDPRAELPFDQITISSEPAAAMGAAPASSSIRRTPGPVPLDAIQLYARAHAAGANNQPVLAVFLLRQALKLDPKSFELHRALGTAYMARPGSHAQAIAAFEAGLALEPDHFAVQLELGRDYLLKGEYPRALDHLLQAARGTDYKDDDANAIVTDFFLGRALQENGYLRAALDRYQLLFARLHQSIPTHARNEVANLAQHPEVIYALIGELQTRRSQWAGARQAFDSAVQRDPDNFELRSRAVRATMLAGDVPAARAAAHAMAVDFHASPESIEFLKQFYLALGEKHGAIDALTELHAGRPGDRALLLGLVDLQVELGRSDDAEKLLASVDPSPVDLTVVRRLLNIFNSRNDLKAAARLLVEVIARQPDGISSLSNELSALLRPALGGRARLDSLQSLQVLPEAEAARWLFIFQLAQFLHRDGLATEALENSVKCQPAFAPAYKAQLDRYWQHDVWDEAKKIAAAQKLVDSLQEQRSNALALEIVGLIRMHEKKYDAACLAFDASMAAGGTFNHLQYCKATALMDADRAREAEPLLWRIVSAAPRMEEAYEALFTLYAHNADLGNATRVLQKWISANSNSIEARVLQARYVIGLVHPDQAEAALLAMLSDHPNDERILPALLSLHRTGDFGGEITSKLRELAKTHPEDRGVLQALSYIYTLQGNLLTAGELLEEARTAAGNDVEQLYFIALLWTDVNPHRHEQVLQEILQLDPQFAPANNDLGYAWADMGKNLDRAENLVRIAVAAAPDNQSYLDSMGWVEYKQGRFEAAKEYLLRALGSADLPDPLVLDHVADTLYRLRFPLQAGLFWNRSLKRMDSLGMDSKELKRLRAHLVEKLNQLENGDLVDVAPVPAKAAIPATQAEQH